MIIHATWLKFADLNTGGSVNWREEHSQPAASAKISPDPGGSANWKHQPYTATCGDKDPARQPYSASHFGPAPNQN
jgi:hypothetical protein